MVRTFHGTRRRGAAGAVNTTRASGFTLVELLVVISIIALLIGILLPALAAARDMARAAVCGSNIRQLAIANVTYMTDNDGHYVPASDNWEPDFPNLMRWHGTRESTSDPFEPEGGPLYEYYNDEDVKMCPLFNEHDFVIGFEAGSGGYGYNETYVGTLIPGDSSRRSKSSGARSTVFHDPTNTVMFTDSGFIQANGDGTHDLIEYSFAEPPHTQWGFASPSIHFRHRGGVNIAWLDGHVDRRQMDFTRGDPDFAFPVGYTADEAEALGFGWFGPDDNSLFGRD